MNFGEWKVKVDKRFDLNTNLIYLYQKTAQGTLFLTRKGDTIIHPFNSAVKYEDVYFAIADDEQLQALADGLADKGFKTTSDSKAEGLLEATRAHLEDMRKIVFKKEGIK